MIGKIDVGESFAGLMAYLTLAERELKPDDIMLFNIGGIRTAAFEMQAAARKSRRVKKPVGHLVLSWRSDEAPTQEKMREAAERVLKQLGIDDHKAVAVIHAGTDNHRHLHVICSRVGPTGTVPAALDSWSFASVERAVASVARDMGFLLVPGRFNSIDSEEFGPAIAPPRDPNLPVSLSEGFRGYHAQTGALAISDELYADPSFREEIIAARMAADWLAFAKAFSRRGFDLCINGKTAGRSPKLDAGLVIVARANPERRQALSALGQTSDEKWSGPGLTRGLGRIGNRRFPPMGSPPEGLMSVAPPTKREQPEEAGPAPEPNAAPQMESTTNLGPDLTAGHQQFSRERETARRHNADVAKARAVARDRVKSDYHQRFEERKEATKFRRQLVREAFGPRSVIGHAINWLADRRRDRDYRNLTTERRAALSAVDAHFRNLRVPEPRWVEFRAKVIAEFHGQRAGACSSPFPIDFGSYQGAASARFETPIDIDAVQSILKVIDAVRARDAVTVAAEQPVIITATSQRKEQESSTPNEEIDPNRTRENSATRNGNDNDDAAQRTKLDPNRVSEPSNGHSPENPPESRIGGREQPISVGFRQEGVRQSVTNPGPLDAAASGQGSARRSDGLAEAPRQVECRDGGGAESGTRAASSNSGAPAAPSLGADDTGSRTRLTSLLRQWAARNAEALKQVFAETAQTQSRASSTPTAQTAKSLATAKLRAWAAKNRGGLVAAADLVRGSANSAAATPSAAYPELRRLVSVARLRAHTALHAKVLTELFDLQDPRPIPDNGVEQIDPMLQSVGMARSPVQPDIVEVDHPAPGESATEGGLAVEPNLTFPPQDPDEVERARISAFKISLRANNRTLGRERLTRITALAYYRWEHRYRTKLEQEFKTFPDNPNAAALGISPKSDPRYFRRRIQALVVHAFKERAAEKREFDAFWEPLNRYARTQSDSNSDIGGPRTTIQSAPTNSANPANVPQAAREKSGSASPKQIVSTTPSGLANPSTSLFAPPSAAPVGAKLSKPPAPAATPRQHIGEPATTSLESGYRSPPAFDPTRLGADDRNLAAAFIALHPYRGVAKIALRLKAIGAAMGAISEASINDWNRRASDGAKRQLVSLFGKNDQGRPNLETLDALIAPILKSRGVNSTNKGAGTGMG